MTGQRLSTSSDKARHAWVDAAKGLCIVLVVLLHSTHGVEKELGALTWMHSVVEWAKPFRMPDFFLIAGLFLGARLALPWRRYLDAKVWHFAYFYVLWFHIHFGLRLKPLVQDVGVDGAVRQYLEGYIDPFGSLWFIYLLAVYCIVVKLLHRQPAWLVAGAGLVAHVMAPHTGIFLVDEFLSRFVFFYVGYAYAPAILDFAERVSRVPMVALWSGMAAWAIINTLGMTTGLARVPGVELVFAALGIAAVIAFCVAITRAPIAATAVDRAGTRLGDALAHCGRNSIVIYLAFSIFMAIARIVLIKFAGGLDGGVIAIASAVAGVSGALVLHLIVRRSMFAFLFERPQLFRVGSRPVPIGGAHAAGG